MSPQASQVHAWQSAVNTVNLTTSGKGPAEKEAIITSADAEKVTIFIKFICLLLFVSLDFMLHAACC